MTHHYLRRAGLLLSQAATCSAFTCKLTSPCRSPDMVTFLALQILRDRAALRKSGWPLGALVTPVPQGATALPVVQGTPISCLHCHSVLNRYCKVRLLGLQVGTGCVGLVMAPHIV